MTTTQELIEWLDVESKLAKKDDSPVASAYLRDAANRLRELEVQLSAAQKDAAWIPVGERLPLEGESIFVFSNLGQADLATVIDGAFEGYWHIDDADETITHWMPMPKLPITKQ